ncbi:MAG: hypothetical protein U5O69_09060 [Candidatus Competibacteraceae bacterium]|nr:hypothetical protein [Candidatus Competibacteraceae bacterium]
MTELTSYEPVDVAEKVNTSLSMSAAFDKFYEVVRKEYAFNGFPGRNPPGWVKSYASIKPRVEQAEKHGSDQAYDEAVRDFIFGFKDGTSACKARC